MEGVEAFNHVWETLIRSPSPPDRLEIYFDGKLSITGRSTAYTNPVIEAGIIHCRALLEFIGLTVPRRDQTKLVERQQKPSGDDVFIENFSLPRVTPDQAASGYPERDVAYRALARVIHAAHKLVAHPTSGLISEPDDLDLFAVASSGVPSLMTSYFYTPLGLAPPSSCITTHPRRTTEAP